MNRRLFIRLPLAAAAVAVPVAAKIPTTPKLDASLINYLGWGDLTRGHLHIITGSAGSGKSLIVQNILMHHIQQGRKVSYVSSELSAKQIESLGMMLSDPTEADVIVLDDTTLTGSACFKMAQDYNAMVIVTIPTVRTTGQTTNLSAIVAVINRKSFFTRLATTHTMITHVPAHPFFRLKQSKNRLTPRRSILDASLVPNTADIGPKMILWAKR